MRISEIVDFDPMAAGEYLTSKLTMDFWDAYLGIT